MTNEAAYAASANVTIATTSVAENLNPQVLGLP